jgi:hypothetical protein
MSAERGKESQRRRICEFLARESQAPVEEVARIYASEWARLARDAGTTDYLAIVTLRNVRKMLRARDTREPSESPPTLA